MTYIIRYEPLGKASQDEPRNILMSIGDAVLTHLFRVSEGGVDNYLRARPSQLAFWLVDNWWRLRWECLPPNGVRADWRLSHDLSSIGGGTAWPRLTIWSEGSRVLFSAKKDPPEAIGPVRFLANGVRSVQAGEWEAAIDGFLNQVSEDLSLASDRLALLAQVESLRNERSQSEFADWRRLEARLGFDVDAAPEELMAAIWRIAEQYEAQDVEEAVQASPGVDAPRILTTAIAVAKSSRLVCDFSDSLREAQVSRDGAINPWEPAERAAQAIRRACGRESGPLRNKVLSSILGVRPNALSNVESSPASEQPYSLRLAIGGRDSGNVVALSTRRSHDRRFELARALGDAIWSNGSTLGPISRTKTDRQRFQRAFAQSLLCPFEDLKDYLGIRLEGVAGDINDEDIMAAATHFHVNKRVVETTLVKKNVLSPQRFEDMVEAA